MKTAAANGCHVKTEITLKHGIGRELTPPPTLDSTAPLYGAINDSVLTLRPGRFAYQSSETVGMKKPYVYVCYR